MNKASKGSPHLISSLISEIAETFINLGYDCVTGPEQETDYYNFEALNIPKNHPARDMWDTFWIKDSDSDLLRAHTSPVQIRYMEKNKPPIKIIVPGKVFRNEATDSTHEAQFYQMEGLYVDKNVNLVDLKSTLKYMLSKLFGDDLEIRFRPSYFPFTEPSIEVYMKRKEDKDWVEVLGGGMVHPKLLTRVGIDPKEYRGFAFGVGVDRIASIRYQFDDIRMLYKGDLRFINQF